MSKEVDPVITQVEVRRQMQWRVHTPRLLREALQNAGAEILHVPFQVLGNILYEVGQRAAELNDPQLNGLMCRLAIYSVADPESPEYDADVVRELLERAQRA